ncbi:MAG: threonylcarbamoyl-AMP synthase [Deltaproteobacteria bacterium]|nr:threonylcarbamoyl-AMP synthase [Deltaproteobacteria bacterium]
MQENFSKIKQLLETGGVIAYPTETVYGLGCDPFNRKALERIFNLKNRSLSQSPLLLIPNTDGLLKWVQNISPLAIRLVEAFWPGPLTIVFSAASDIPPWLIRDNETIALRWSSHPWIKAFLDFYQKPLISTSANPSGQKSALSQEEVGYYFSSGIDHCVDGGTLPPSKGSTIVAIQDRDIQILRQGDISLARLMEVADGKRTSI